MSRVIFATCLLFLFVGCSYTTPTTVTSPPPSTVPSHGDVFNETCVSYEWREVRGESMTPTLEPGDDVLIALNYYSCNKILPGEIVVYEDPRGTGLLVKRVHAVPGDTFSLRPVSGGYELLVNDVAVRNAANRTWRFTGNTYEMLRVYEESYNGVIPGNAYLVLGEQPGAYGSTMHGLIDVEALRGVVVRIEEPS